jgi:hypothetical protein
VSLKVSYLKNNFVHLYESEDSFVLAYSFPKKYRLVLSLKTQDSGHHYSSPHESEDSWDKNDQVFIILTFLFSKSFYMFYVSELSLA